MNRLRVTVCVVVTFCVAGTVPAPADWELEAFAGGGPHRLPALESNLNRPKSVARDAAGRLYVLAGDEGSVFRIDAAGILELILDSRANDPLAGAFLHEATDIALDDAGRLLVADRLGFVRFDAGSGEIIRFQVGPGLPARAVAVHPDGSVYVLAAYFEVPSALYRVDIETGASEHVAGLLCFFRPYPPGCSSPLEDGAPATEVALHGAVDLAVSANGDVYIGAARGVLRIDASSGLIHRVAGNGTSGFSGDGGPATQASLRGISYFAVDAAGNLWISDSQNHRVRWVDAATGIIDTIAGDGTAGFEGDGGPALGARLDRPAGLVVGADGTAWIADTLNMRVRRLDASTGILDTVAGNGSATFSGDGHPATRASITGMEVAVDAAGNVYIADTYNHRIRKIERASGLISTYAGTGSDAENVEDDGVPGLEAVLPRPRNIAVDSQGNLFVIVGYDRRLRRIDAVSGIVSTIPGRYDRIALDEQGRLYADAGGFYDWGRIERVDIETGAREPVVGNTDGEYNGEGVPALEAGIQSLSSFRFDENGDLYLVDWSYGLIRRVDAQSGLIHTVAGGPNPSYVEPGSPPSSVPAIGAIVAPTLIAVEDSSVLLAPRWVYSGVGRIDTLTGRLEWHWGLGPVAYNDPRPQPDPAIYPSTLELDGEGNWYVGSGNRVLLARNTNHPPVADAGGDRVVPCAVGEGTRVVLNGASSHDVDDAAGAPPEIVEFWWYEDFGLPSQRRIGTGEITEVDLPVGLHAMTLQVGDRWSARTRDAFTIEVLDEEDPDGDGVGSCADNCPGLSNVDQTDADGNGLGDACDPCRGSPFDDTDGDGVCADADNCPDLRNPEQLDGDADSVGDACDVCRATANPDQTEHGTCFDTRPAGECLGMMAEVRGEHPYGRILLSGVERSIPTEIRFRISYRSSSGARSIAFQLNDVPLGTWTGEPSSVSCRTTVFTISDSALIASAWRTEVENQFRVRQLEGSGISRVTAELVAGEETHYVCLHNPSGVDCSISTSCASGSFLHDLTVVVRDPFYRVTELLEQNFGPGPPATSFDLDSLPDGDYRLCVATTDPVEPGTLFAANDYGTLSQLDWLTAEQSPVGVLPATPLDIAHDRVTGSSMLSTGLRMLQRFDYRDGIGSAGVVVTDWSLGQLEFVPWGLLGATTLYISGEYQLRFWTELYVVDPNVGDLEWFATVDTRRINGLAYDETTGELYAHASGLYGGWAELLRLDPETGESRPVDSTRLELSGLAVGPDGLLYAVGPEDGVLYRVDAETARAMPVGATGIQSPRALMRTGRQGAVDCVEFSKQGESLLALNSSCGPPLAAAATPATSAECTSENGGLFLFDGSTSTDPNSTLGTNDGLVAFEWFLDHGLPGQTSLGSGQTLSVALPLGTHRVILQVTNIYGERATDSIDVEVADTVPPSLEVALTPNLLWPPNHRMVEVLADVTATDACGEPAVGLLSILSSEPDDATGSGDGHTTDDVQHAELGTADLRFELRAERAARGRGRVYTVSYAATDGAGHESVAEATVVVPHNVSRSVPSPTRIGSEATTKSAARHPQQ